MRSCAARSPRKAPDGPRVRGTEGPLAGVRVLDFCWVWAGPFCTLQLAHLGAQVIRVETTKRPDINRVIPPFADKQPGLNRGGSFNQWNQGKLSLQLDLSRPEAIEICHQLVPHVDLVTENYAPGVIERMGLGYERLRAIKPDLIMLSLSGYGQSGPASRYVSYGAMIAAQAGLYAATGYPGDVPREVGVSYADPVAGITGALDDPGRAHPSRPHRRGSVSRRRRCWKRWKCSCPKRCCSTRSTGASPQYMGNRDLWMAPHNCYKSRGDAEQWVTIAVGTEAEWRALCDVMGQPSLADDPRFRTAALRKQNEDELDRIITAWTSPRDRWEVTAGVAARGRGRDSDLHQQGPGAGSASARARLPGGTGASGGRQAHPRRHPLEDERDAVPGAPAAALMGQDTDDILSSILGYSPTKIEQLRQAGMLT